jgi:hypothetical protein
MLVRSKMSRLTTVLFACATLLSSPAWAANGKHPDGPAATYRGWGPTDLLADGYECSLFDSLGVRAGSIAFHSDGTLDLSIGTEQAHFQAAPVGVTQFYDLDAVADSFPSIPQKYRGKGYRIMTFTGRFAVGENIFVIDPATELAESISVVEARCVYIVDADGNVLFCLNCTFVIS